MSNAKDNRVAPIFSITQEVWEPKSLEPREPREPRRRSIIRDFALNASTHGLSAIANSRSKHNLIFWTVSFLIFFGGMIYFVTESVADYFAYPTQTSISIVVERSQTFPAVTFCNYSPVRYDRIIGPFLNYTNSINLTNTNDTSDTSIFTPELVVVLEAYLEDSLNAGDSINQYFFSLDTMLINCIYNGITCTADDFISFLSSGYGLCFTFNAKTNNANGTAIRNTIDNGGSGELQLQLYAQSHLYVPYASDDVSAGIVAMIHDNTQLPQIDVAGISLAPGRRHKLGYKKKTTYFLSSPYTDCTNDIPLVMQAMFSQYGGADYTYSQSICYTLCTQAYIYQECGCVSPTQWTARSVVLPGTNTIIEAPLCDLTETCYLNATVTLSNTLSIWDEFCSNCTQECSTVDFSVTPSSASAPSSPYAYIAKAFVESAPVPLPTNWSTDWLSEVKKNYVSIDVVCQSVQVENYTQAASISAVDLLSNVGGVAALWIGLSFLSLMELVEMAYLLLRHEYRIIRRAIRNKFRENNN